MTKIPIACTLTNEEMPVRIREWHELRERALLSANEIPGGMELRFAIDATDEVHRLIAAEEQCCAFLTFSVRDDEPGALIVDVVAPAGAEAVTHTLAGR